MARAWLAVYVCVLVACSPTRTGNITKDRAGSPPADPLDVGGVSRELIPAEWTIAEDTSAGGEVTTASLQLPSARDIGGLLDEEQPRLVLRCLDGKVQAFIDTEPAEGRTESGVPDSQLVAVQLDSAPACE